MAKEFGLPTYDKKDSQGLCFIGKVNMKDFLSHYITPKRGDVLNETGEIIGHHDGAMFYTIGQRHGFIITKKSANDPRLFVVSKNLEKNTITVTNQKSQSDSYSAKEIMLKNLNFISGQEPVFPLKTSVRIRYRQKKQSCALEKKSSGYRAIFDTSQRGLTLQLKRDFRECKTYG